jgi:hypothetical protein
MNRPYRPADPDNHAVESARAAFLNFYRLHRPELMLRLRDRALPVFSHQVPAELHIVLDLSDWYVMQVECPELVKVLTSWAEEFGLTFQQKAADWALLFALATLDLWERSPKALQSLRWGRPAGLQEEFPAAEFGLKSLGGEPEGEIFDIRVEFNWNWADGESQRDFRRRQHDLVRTATEQRIAMVEQEIGEKGWTRAPLPGCEYLEALAMRKAHKSFTSIYAQMRSRRIHVGSEGDVSGLAHGIERVARSIQVDAPTAVRHNLK